VRTKYIVSLRSIAAALSIVFFGTLLGCNNGPKKAQLTGNVTLDGEPLKSGSMDFFPVDGQGSTANGFIVDGKYTAETGVGKMKVEIRARKVIGQKKMYDTPDSPMRDEVVELLPERYNVKSELTVDLKEGKNEKDFELTSKKK
jgi:hypothetical protein